MTRGRQLKRRINQTDPLKSVDQKLVSSSQIDGKLFADKKTEMESSIKSKAEGTSHDMSKKEDDVVIPTTEAPFEEVGKQTLRGKEQLNKNRFNENKNFASSITKNEKDRVKERGKRTGQNLFKQKQSMDDLAGLIFMCSNETKRDCFKYRVFGLPEAKKNMVEQVKKGTKLFLFDVDKRILYGVYKATSEGGINLVEQAFKNSSRKFPAQVRFEIHKDCMPLEESVFKQAIRENYFQGSKFKCELNEEQVRKLLRLFRPLDYRGLPNPKSGKEVKRQSNYKSNIPRGHVGTPIELGSPLKHAHLHHGREQVHPREYTHAREDFRVPLSYTREDVNMSSVYARDRVNLPSLSYGREDVRMPSLSYVREDFVHVPSLAYAREDEHIPSSSYAREDVVFPSSSYAIEDVRLPLSSAYERLDVRLPISSYARDDVTVSEGPAETETFYRKRLHRRQQRDSQLESLARTTSYAMGPMALDGSLPHRMYMDNDAYAEQQAFVIPRRPLIQDQHFYRDLEYQREIPSRVYGGNLHGISGAMTYDPAPRFNHRSYGL